MPFAFFMEFWEMECNYVYEDKIYNLENPLSEILRKTPWKNAYLLIYLEVDTFFPSDCQNSTETNISFCWTWI